MSEEARITAATVCAAIGLAFGYGIGLIATDVAPMLDVNASAGIRLVLASGFAAAAFFRTLKLSRTGQSL